MGDEVVEELVEPLRAAFDQLLGADLTRLSSVQLTGLLRGLEVERRRLAGVDHRVLVEVDQRGVAGDYGRSSTADLLVTMVRVAPGEARARVVQARELRPVVMPSGERVPAVLPGCADAVDAGEISAAHVAVIGKTLDRIPPAVAYEAGPVAEAMLVEAARHQHPVALGQTAALLLARLDPDGVQPREEELERRRGFTLSRRGDGMRRVSGDWTPELAAVWDAILDSLAAPLPAVDGGTGGGVDSGVDSGVDGGVEDERSPAQRRHDAMLEAGTRLLRSGELPSCNGVPVTVLLRITPNDLSSDRTGDLAGGRTGDQAGDHGGGSQTGDHRDGTADVRDGTALTSTGDIWPARRVRANLGDAAVVPIVFDHTGAALWCGRTRRLATRAQRLALTARDGGCVFPGCSRPAAWCEVHHVVEWILGGRTDVDNLCLLCRYHHRAFARAGWLVQMAGGVPQWIPPAFIDQHRRPIRNTVHHLPDIDFGVDVDIGRAG